ncbi:MAG: phytoene/squalene synthase family protein [Rhodobiaceae bacterium]|nr:phytoene/squalene synthase family protein [Rhodobiaceae bacterium]MCC0047983.1 phytoene/squalene synthase family protein [Rhodobiaceae bacterium]
MPAELEQAYAHCESLLREADKDRYLSSLFAPADKRPHLHALYALVSEISSVRDKVREPMPGEIRMQWWMDALDGSPCGDAKANPVFCAVHDTITRFGLPVTAFVNMIDARIFDLYDDPMPTMGDLVGYAGETCSAVMQLAAIILNDGEQPCTADIAGHAGVACTMAYALWNLPKHTARGQLYIPLDILEANGACREDVISREATPEVLQALKDFHEAAVDHVSAVRCYADQIPRKAAVAFLPTALVRHYLAACGKVNDPLNEQARLPQWRRQWTLWRAARHAGKVCCGSS